MSWKILKKAFTNREMQKKFAVVALLLVIYRILSFIPVPVADPVQLRQALQTAFESQQLLGFVDLLAGGALANFSIMLMGLGPYINASIITQILSKTVPRLKELQKEGQQGQTKINQYTRMLSVPLALGQSYAMIQILRQSVLASGGFDITAQASTFDWFLMMLTLTAGSILLMWIGELITEEGIGNGISLIIFAGITTQLPAILNTFLASLIGTGQSLNVFGWFSLPVDGTSLAIIAGYLIATLIVIYIVVKLNEAQRIITVSYAKRVKGNRQYGGVDTILPIKLIIAGVIPIIFAVAFLTVPQFVGTLIQNSTTPWLAELGRNLVEWFSVGGGYFGGQSAQNATVESYYIYSSIYFLMVVAFTYFYTGVVFNSKDISENLQKQGGFIAGVRPGKQTEKFLKAIVNRLTLFGSVSLGLIAVLPFIAQLITGNPLLTIGGTGILIVVSVALETLRKVESQALMVTYDDY